MTAQSAGLEQRARELLAVVSSALFSSKPSAEQDAIDAIVAALAAAPAADGDWQTVPKAANGLLLDTIRTQLACDTGSAQRFWDKCLYWATAAPRRREGEMATKRKNPNSPAVGRVVIYGGVECEVVDVKAGPMLVNTADFDLPEAPIKSTVCLRLKYPGGAEVWTPPMESVSFNKWLARPTVEQTP